MPKKKYYQFSEETKTRKFSQDYYDVLATFNAIAKKYPLLSKRAERALIDMYRNDRQKLNRLLFYHNIRLVMNLAKKYIFTFPSPADLLMNGAQGLMEATKRFDINKGTKFNTYATSWVFKYILMVFYSKSPVTGVNQTSLNDMIWGEDSTTEQMDYLTDGNISDVSTSLSGGGNNSFMDNIDFSFFEKRNISSPSSEYEISANNTLVQDVIDAISADPHFNELDRDIIYNNMMDNAESINSLSQKYNVSSNEITKRKRKIISNFKTILSKKYNVKALSDVI